MTVLRWLLAVLLASGCMPASSPPARRGGATREEPPQAAGLSNWLGTTALPPQRISRASVGLAAGARGWATLTGESGVTLFYPLTPAPDDPDLLDLGSPLRDE